MSSLWNENIDVAVTGKGICQFVVILPANVWNFRVVQGLQKTDHLAVLDGFEVRNVAGCQARGNALQCSLREGGRMPAHCTALGKVLVACADVVRSWSLPALTSAVRSPEMSTGFVGRS